MQTSDNRIICLLYTGCLSTSSTLSVNTFFTIDIVHTFETRLENRYRIRDSRDIVKYVPNHFCRFVIRAAFVYTTKLYINLIHLSRNRFDYLKICCV